MIKFEDIIERTPIYRVFLSIFAVILFFIWALFWLIGNPEIPITRAALSGLIMSFLFSFVFTGLIWVARKTMEFYRDCDVLEEKIKGVKYRDEIRDLYKNEFMPLYDRSFDKGTRSRIRELEKFMRHLVGYLPKRPE